MSKDIETIKINEVEYVRKDSMTQMAETETGLKAVLIRSYAAGVHFGYLKSEKFTHSGKVVTLIKSRRIWMWDGACSLSQVAIDGVNSNSKISVTVPEIEIVNCIETIPLTERAKNNLYGVAVWKK